MGWGDKESLAHNMSEVVPRKLNARKLENFRSDNYKRKYLVLSG